jgi:hypothetical protein
MVFLLIISMVYLNHFTLRFNEPFMTDAAGKQVKISLPYTQEMEAVEYVISGKINYYKLFSADTVQIIPDDEVLGIRVNGRGVPLDGVDPNSLKDYFLGFHFNLGRYLHNGANEIEIRIKNSGGASGLFFQDSRHDIKTLIAQCLLMISILSILYLMLTGMIPNRIAVLILLGGLLIRVVYFLATPYDLREHDVFLHMEYIGYILDHGALPPKDYGLLTYHPPLYFISAALIDKAGNFLGMINNYFLLRVLQFFSLLLSMGFLFCAFFIFQTIMSRIPGFQTMSGKHKTSAMNGQKSSQNRYICLMLALLTFWPSNIIHSVRIGNDVMFYFLYSLGLLFLVKWYFDHRARSMYSAFIFITLCFITKANALVLYGAAGIVFLMKWLKDRDLKKYLIRTAIIFVICSVGFWITLGASLEEKLHGSAQNLIVGNRTGSEEIGLENTPWNYLWFDLTDFIKEPYMQPWGEQRGRQFFWNYLYKTALVGEFEFGSFFHQVLTTLLSVLFLGMLCLTVLGLIIIIRNDFKTHLVLLLNLIMLLIAAILLRITIPVACSNDFRYILPILIPFCFFYGYTLLSLRRKGWVELELTGFILAILFAFTSILFITGLHFC